MRFEWVVTILRVIPVCVVAVNRSQHNMSGVDVATVR